MFRTLKKFQFYRKCANLHNWSKSNIQLNVPKSADVVIIGGGSAGCYTLYHLAKRGVNCVLLERCELTSGTTWHTNGLMWRIRPNDVDIQLLNRSRDTILDIIQNTEFDPGWTENGGLFIARTNVRLDEYERLSKIAQVFNIEHSMLTAEETTNMFPLLNRDKFIGSLYSPCDGIVDPTMLCNALTKLAIKTDHAQVIENCSVSRIVVNNNYRGNKCVVGVETDHGIINTDCIVNATGVWGRDLIESHGINLPLIPMRHSYIVTEPIKGIRGMPNIRDHDGSIAFRIQGESIYLGGYEKNPIILDNVANDFHFSLYDLDWSTFDSHVEHAVDLFPAFATVGIKCTVCGPESFTPDHKPIMGPDPRLIGLFHNCGYNSAGLMFGGGCGEQLAEWIIHGRPQLHMFNFDIRRFTPNQLCNKKWAIERSHESYAENYAIVFANAQTLAGRNFKMDSLHETMILNGAVMEACHGYERPGFFNKFEAPVPPYDWYGAYGNKINSNQMYLDILHGDQKYDFSDHHETIGSEALSCRTTAAVFNLSSFCKIYLYGSDAKEALEWICTADVNKPINTIVYTCALNKRGGVECDFTVTILEPQNVMINNQCIQAIDGGNVYYIVAAGSSAYHILSHINEAILEKQFNVNVKDVTDKIGILSIQGPNSRKIIEEISGVNLRKEKLSPFTSTTFNLTDTHLKGSPIPIRLLSISYVGELGFELHIENKNCSMVYDLIMSIGATYGLKNAGFRALHSLSCEKGHLLWGYDLRADDTPIESNLEFVCRRNGIYKGSNFVEKQRADGVNKRLVYLTIEEKLPLWGLEGVYRNGKAVGHLRRAEFGYFINKSIGKSFICSKDDLIDKDYLDKGEYEIDALGKRCVAKLHYI